MRGSPFQQIRNIGVSSVDGRQQELPSDLGKYLVTRILAFHTKTHTRQRFVAEVMENMSSMKNLLESRCVEGEQIPHGLKPQNMSCLFRCFRALLLQQNTPTMILYLNLLWKDNTFIEKCDEGKVLESSEYFTRATDLNHLIYHMPSGVFYSPQLQKITYTSDQLPSTMNIIVIFSQLTPYQQATTKVCLGQTSFDTLQKKVLSHAVPFVHKDLQKIFAQSSKKDSEGIPLSEKISARYTLMSFPKAQQLHYNLVKRVPVDEQNKCAYAFLDMECVINKDRSFRPFLLVVRTLRNCPPHSFDGPNVLVEQDYVWGLDEVGDPDGEVFCERMMGLLQRMIFDRKKQFEWSVYAHNGCKFDYIFILKKLLLKFRGKVRYCGSINALKYLQLGKRIKFFDSLHILPRSLKVLSATFLPNVDDRKVELDVDWETLTLEQLNGDANLRSEILKYCARDCSSLCLILGKFFNMINTQILSHPNNNYFKIFKINSISTLSIHILRAFIARSYMAGDWKRSIKGDYLSVEQSIRSSYYGGVVAVYKPCFMGKFAVFDVNSLYPFIMKSYKMPIDYAQQGGIISSMKEPHKFGYIQYLGRHEFRLDEGEQDSQTFNMKTKIALNKYIERYDRVLLYVESYEIKNTKYPFLPYRGSSGSTWYCLKSSSPSWRWGVEIRYGLVHNLFRSLHVMAVIPFVGAMIFKDYIGTVNCMKERATKELERNPKAQDSSCLRFVTKLLMNSAYGKMGQRMFDEKLLTVNGEPVSQVKFNMDFIRQNVGVYKRLDSTNEMEWEDLEVGINRDNFVTNNMSIGAMVKVASFITAAARVYLFETIHSVERGRDGKGEVIYCDTDSVVVGEQDYLPMSVRDEVEIGKWKKEDEFVEGFFLAPKLKIMVKENGSITMTSRGFPVQEMRKIISLDKLRELRFTPEGYQKYLQSVDTKLFVKQFGGVSYLDRKKKIRAVLDRRQFDFEKNTSFPFLFPCWKNQTN